MNIIKRAGVFIGLVYFTVLLIIYGEHIVRSYATEDCMPAGLYYYAEGAAYTNLPVCKDEPKSSYKGTELFPTSPNIDKPLRMTTDIMVHPISSTSDLGPMDVPPDMYPMYSCPNLSNSSPLPLWYGSCINSCQITSSKETMAVTVWAINSTVDIIMGYKLTTFFETKFSHVGPFGGCSISLVGSEPRSAPEALISGWRSKILSQGNIQDAAWYLYNDPECNYFSDIYSSGFFVRIDRIKLTVLIDAVGNLYLSDLVAGSYDSYDKGFATHGNNVWIWDTDRVKVDNNCYFKQTDDTYCDYDNTTGYILCKTIGVSFRSELQTRVESPCAGHLNISTDGVIYRLEGTADTPSTQDRLSSILKNNVNLGMESLISLINDVFTNIESSYCTGMCDLMEVILSNYPTATTVLETPIGPWLPITTNGHTVMTACSSDPNWVIKTPVSYCYSKKMIKVVNKDTMREAWWRIVNSYIILNETCTDENTTSFNLVKERMELRQDITYSFWRGDLIVSYPYNKSRWITYKDEKIQRSSKWFDKLLPLRYNHPITLDNITMELINHTRDIYDVHVYPSQGSTSKRPMSDVIGRVGAAGSNLIKHLVKGIGETFFWVTQHIELICDILIIIVCVVIGYCVVLKPILYITMRGREKQQPVIVMRDEGRSHLFSRSTATNAL
ncbi:glycoprotein [rice transitory yellowing virus]|uniref:Glycoprotein n=1 Tax=Rice yellow stunt virus TaxID=59380 RepID=GLYCO_RYSV|nr:glycoprotein [rice transitory yellowing virus]O10236.2 RecName: Full=Glycoprotein; Flags: Precursor [rice transitory yellowing virus]BAA25158.1 glycoprotein [rice transitory yellowing virus]